MHRCELSNKSTSEELEVAEVEAGFAPVEFPVVNISTGTFSPIASLCDDTNEMLRTLLKSVSELSTKIDKMLFLYERLAMGVTDRRTEEMDNDAKHFPLRTHEELRSLEAALENQKYRGHFVLCVHVSGVRPVRERSRMPWLQQARSSCMTQEIKCINVDGDPKKG
ncbi:unnamed protein product [Schistosoma mattheei]|uniref:Uncharacterized protein n=1 Tax=Schistosoma mattheei TaxID=31246 RepID=A0A183PXY6_9TREM|nr:unnamed protein product [Schistosoma mattheei]